MAFVSCHFAAHEGENNRETRNGNCEEMFNGARVGWTTSHVSRPAMLLLLTSSNLVLPVLGNRSAAVRLVQFVLEFDSFLLLGLPNFTMHPSHFVSFARVQTELRLFSSALLNPLCLAAFDTNAAHLSKVCALVVLCCHACDSCIISPTGAFGCAL